MASHVPETNEQGVDYSDAALESLLQELKSATDPEIVARLSRQIERVVFHKQLENA